MGVEVNVLVTCYAGKLIRLPLLVYWMFAQPGGCQ
jgi:hypothetical protein